MVTYVLACHSLDQDFGMMVNEDIWLSFFGIGASFDEVNETFGGVRCSDYFRQHIDTNFNKL